MATYVDNCPRCSTQSITFDVYGLNHCGFHDGPIHNKIRQYEFYCVCRQCYQTTIFIGTAREARADLTNINIVMATYGLKEVANISRPISPADLSTNEPPDFLPQEINDAYMEGAKCLAVGCYNAAGTMFRLCLDYATKQFIPEGNDGPNTKVRRSLGLRMDWLFDNRHIPAELKDLAECVKDDGNDGAHTGALDRLAAEDIEEFTYLFLERLYTEPTRLAEAKERRAKRRINL